MRACLSTMTADTDDETGTQTVAGPSKTPGNAKPASKVAVRPLFSFFRRSDGAAKPEDDQPVTVLAGKRKPGSPKEGAVCSSPEQGRSC